MSQERSTLLDKMLSIGAAAGLRGKANEKKSKLDAAGVEHKAAKSEKDKAKTKALMEAIRAKIEAAIGQVTEGAPPELVDAVMQVIMQNAMETPAAEAPVEEAPMEEMAEGEDVLVEEEPEEEEMEADELEDEEEKSLTVKATHLFDELIQDQAQITQDVSVIVKAVEPVAALVKQVENLTTKVAALEKQLRNRPRMASRASETEIETDELSEEIQKSLVTRHPFFGVNVAPEGS